MINMLSGLKAQGWRWTQAIVNASKLGTLEGFYIDRHNKSYWLPVVHSDVPSATRAQLEHKIQTWLPVLSRTVTSLRFTPSIEGKLLDTPTIFQWISVIGLLLLLSIVVLTPAVFAALFWPSAEAIQVAIGGCVMLTMAVLGLCIFYYSGAPFSIMSACQLMILIGDAELLTVFLLEYQGEEYSLDHVRAVSTALRAEDLKAFVELSDMGLMVEASVALEDLVGSIVKKHLTSSS